MYNRSVPFATALLPVLFVFTTPSFAQTELKLSGIFGDHMVLHRDRPVTIWGVAEKDKLVTVKFAGQAIATTADERGAWLLLLNPMKSNRKGRDLSVSCSDKSVILHNIVVGDVWHASGQSNMAMNVGAVARRLPQAQQQIREATLPGIRFRRINENESEKPLDDLPHRAGWSVCAPNTVSGFSAAAFYFARKLHAEIGVPIGVIDSSRGGTPIEPFIPRAAFQSHPTLRRELELGDQGDLRGIWRLPGGVRARDANWLPGRLFHSRLAPIIRFAVRGAIWYQGESNCGDSEDPRDYQHKMRALITAWRKALGNDELPVYIVQLPGSGARAGWPYLREQQRLSTDLPHTELVVTIDLLDKDIHPPNKLDVGERLARWALAKEYGKTTSFSGPLFQRVETADGQATIHFAYAESGLMVAKKDGLAAPIESPQTKLSHFELADTTGRWHPAEAKIMGRTVVVSSAKPLQVVAVRYAYAVDPQHCHLYNRDGLPASPFCSHPDLLKYVPELPSE
jgi:sialate O-acetylesterase